MKEFSCEEYVEWVAADVDGVLEPDEKTAVDIHVSTCIRCRTLRHQQLLVRSTIRDKIPQRAAPAILRQRIAAALDEEVITQPGVTSVRARKHTRRWLLVGAVAAGFALVVSPILRSTSQDLLAVLVSDAEAAEAGQLPIELVSANVAAVRGYYRESGQIAFENSADDLGPLGFHIVGANVARIGEVNTTLTLYENDSAKVVCRRFPSGSLTLPTGGDQVGGAQLFTLDGVTVAITQLGDVTCCLATTMPRDEFIRRLASSDHRH